MAMAVLAIGPIAFAFLFVQRYFIRGITLGGLVLSFDYDLPSGPAIILLGAVLLVGVYGMKKLRRGRPQAAPTTSGANGS